jgi:hypothetical protein
VFCALVLPSRLQPSDNITPSETDSTTVRDVISPCRKYGTYAGLQTPFLFFRPKVAAAGAHEGSTCTPPTPIVLAVMHVLSIGRNYCGGAAAVAGAVSCGSARHNCVPSSCSFVVMDSRGSSDNGGDGGRRCNGIRYVVTCSVQHNKQRTQPLQLTGPTESISGVEG